MVSGSAIPLFATDLSTHLSLLSLPFSALFILSLGPSLRSFTVPRGSSLFSSLFWFLGCLGMVVSIFSNGPQPEQRHPTKQQSGSSAT